jgi:hypothetical protein
MATVDITVENDADFYREFHYVTTSDMPIDMTSSTLEMMLRRRAEDAAAQMRLSTETGEIVFIDALQGQFTIMIRQADLERLGLGEFDHSLIMTKDGMKTRLWSGLFTNNAGPTR